MVVSELQSEAVAFERPVHPANEDRLRKLCWAKRRQAVFEPLAEGWLTLRVEAAARPPLRVISGGG